MKQVHSLGVTLVRDRGGYRTALDVAFAHSGEALVESFVELGREVRCGIVVTGGELICLPLEEYNVSRDARPIREHADKISRNDAGDLNLVAKDTTRAWIVDTDDPITRPVWAAAKRCHTALGCRDYSLFDFRIDPDGRPWFLEAGLYCSFAGTSVISMMAAAAGIPLPELFQLAISGRDVDAYRLIRELPGRGVRQVADVPSCSCCQLQAWLFQCRISTFCANALPA